MADWTAGVTAIFVRAALVPVNGTCLGYEVLVNSTIPIRGNGIAKTRAFCSVSVDRIAIGSVNCFEPTKFVFAVTSFLGDIMRFFETGHVF